MRRIDKKPETATTGFFYLDHAPTGKCYTGVSKDMQNTIMDIREELQSGVCNDKRLTRLYVSEPDFKAYTEATRGLREAKALEKEFRRKLPPFLLIN